jgi:hypothetical protein
MRRSLPE